MLDCLSAAFGQSNYRKELRPGAHAGSESDALRHFLTLISVIPEYMGSGLRLSCRCGEV
jgi:hypothetical protein